MLAAARVGFDAGVENPPVEVRRVFDFAEIIGVGRRFGISEIPFDRGRRPEQPGRAKLGAPDADQVSPAHGGVLDGGSLGKGFEQGEGRKESRGPKQLGRLVFIQAQEVRHGRRRPQRGQRPGGEKDPVHIDGWAHRHPHPGDHIVPHDDGREEILGGEFPLLADRQGGRDHGDARVGVRGPVDVVQFEVKGHGRICKGGDLRACGFIAPPEGGTACRRNLMRKGPHAFAGGRGRTGKPDGQNIGRPPLSLPDQVRRQIFKSRICRISSQTFRGCRFFRHIALSLASLYTEAL